MTNHSPHIAGSANARHYGELREAPAPSLALARSAHFVRENYGKLLAISAAVLLPCFWHGHIEAGDLASHTYNAWLAQLIERAQITGLHVARVWDNVLFDLLLGGLGKLFPLLVAEKIAVSTAALVFFWGAFAFISAATKHAPWYLIPAIAMAAYGWTFEMGFCNYYLSLGISFFALAIFWRGERWERLIPLVLAPLVLLAHPMGVVWMAGAALYIELARILPRRYQLVLFLAAAAAIFLCRLYLFHHYVADGEAGPFYFFSGADQLILYGKRYWIPAAGLLLLFAGMMARDFAGGVSGADLWARLSFPLQFYVLIELAAFWLPDGIHLPQFPAALALITQRVTSISLVLLCCLAGAVRPRRWHLWTLAPAAILFFTFLYQDTGAVNRMENEAGGLIGTVPRGSRILATILPPSESRVLVQHIADRACIGRCFSYGNYEPASGAFRIRVDRPNPYVMMEFNSAADMERGQYVIRPDDLPAYQLFQCGVAWTKLCIRPLKAGESNGRLGVHAKE